MNTELIEIIKLSVVPVAIWMLKLMLSINKAIGEIRTDIRLQSQAHENLSKDMIKLETVVEEVRTDVAHLGERISRVEAKI